MDYAYEQVLARRKARLLNDYLLTGKRGVEVGPLSRPVVRRDEAEVYYVDHCTTEELKQKYSGDHAHIDGIEQVDFVWGDQSLVEVIGDKAPLDFVVAAHVIEHVPDLRGWLGEMHDALRVGGRLLLIVPDKRFTFDIRRGLSSFEEVVQAASERRRRPGLRPVMDHFANVVAADTWRLWDDYTLADNLHYYHGPEFLERAMRLYAKGEYIDIHAWVFTPWHFMYLMGRMVHEMGLKFDLKFFLTTQDHDLEFYVQLERVETPTTDWKAEAERAEREALWPDNSSEQQNAALWAKLVQQNTELVEQREKLEQQSAGYLAEVQALRIELQALASELQAERSITMIERTRMGFKSRLGSLIK